MKFSMVQKLDTNILDSKLCEWITAEEYKPIILLSPDTLGDMPKLVRCEMYNTKNNCTGMIGTYHGYKVFSDPTMQYGEVELR